MTREASGKEAATRRLDWRWVLRGTGSVGLAATLLGIVLPRVTGTHWSQIAGVVTHLSAVEIAALTGVWLVALWCYGFVITATVPGIRHSQAVIVNVTSSAVSNLIPFGGALGLAVTFTMARSWGFPASAVALSALVTGIWNVFAKLALPMLGLLTLTLASGASASWLVRPAAIGAAVFAAVLTVAVGTLRSQAMATAIGRAGQVAGQIGLRLVGSRHRLTWDQEVPRWRLRVINLVRQGWPRLTLGLVGFLGAQAALLYLILTTLGSTLGPAQVFAGFAFGRLLTIIVVTPAGTGFTETGTAGLLIALGGDPTICTSAALLFSGFVVFLEIPLGGVGYLVWLLHRSWRRRLARRRLARRRLARCPPTFTHWRGVRQRSPTGLVPRPRTVTPSLDEANRASLNEARCVTSRIYPPEAMPV